MAQSTSPGVPTGLALRPLVTRSNSITSTNSANSTASLRRRSRTRTRTLTSAGRRGKSIGAPDVSKVLVHFLRLSASANTRPYALIQRSGPENGAVSQPEIPPVPARSPRRPRAAPSRLPIPLQETRDKKPHTRERALSAVHVRDTAGGDANRGRATKSEGGSVKAVCPVFLSCRVEGTDSCEAQAEGPWNEPAQKCVPYDVLVRRVVSGQSPHTNIVFGRSIRPCRQRGKPAFQRLYNLHLVLAISSFHLDGVLPRIIHPPPLTTR